MSHLNLAWAGVKKPHCRNCLRTTLLRLREIQSQVQNEPDFTSLWNKTQSTSAFEWQNIHRRSLINLAIKVYKPESQQDLGINMQKRPNVTTLYLLMTTYE